MPAKKPTHSANAYGLARILSKRGYCSRAEATELIRQGRVSVDGRTILDPEHRTRLDHRAIRVDGTLIGSLAKSVYLMLNKPRGLVTSSADELGRETVYACFAGAELPRVIAVGRLDKASEGLLFFTNDTAWAERLTAPDGHVAKVYHVQVAPPPSPQQLLAMRQGIEVEPGLVLAVTNVTLLRSGGITAWLEITLHEGKNRQIRRILEAMGLETRRLIRTAIGPQTLGDLPKGQWRHLSPTELAAF